MDLGFEEQLALLRAAAEIVVEHGRSVTALPVSPTLSELSIRTTLRGFDLEVAEPPWRSWTGSPLC